MATGVTDRLFDVGDLVTVLGESFSATVTT